MSDDLELGFDWQNKGRRKPSTAHNMRTWHGRRALNFAAPIATSAFAERAWWTV